MPSLPEAAPAASAPAGRWLLRGAVIVGALAFSLAALGSGLDRMSRSDPRIAAVVPGPFRANADRALAQLALGSENYAAMKAPAAAAVRRDPMVATSSALYGWSLYASGEGEPATQAFRVAGQLGWRDPLVQIYWFAAAMEQADYPVAAMRLDALLRQVPGDPQRDPLVYRLEAVPQGRAALVERLRERPNWLAAYASDINPLPPQQAEARYQTLLLLGQSGARLGCEGIARYVSRLASAKMPDQALGLRAAHCPGNGGLLSDGQFENARLDRPLTPFDWNFAADGSLDMVLAEHPGMRGKALAVANTSPVTRAFATQTLRLVPGRYRLAGSISGESPADLARFGLALNCAGEVRSDISRIGFGKDRFAVDLDIGKGCATQMLSLTIAPGTSQVVIDDLSLVRR